MTSAGAGASVATVDWWSRCRSDLARPDIPVASGARLFLIVSAAVIVVMAQISDPAAARDLLLLVPALIGAVALAARLHRVDDGRR